MTDVIHVDAARLADLVSPEAAIAAVRQAFLGLARGDFELPHRLSLGAGAALVMPVHHIPSAETVIKSLSVNFDRAPAISGSTLWMSASSERVLVIDACALTAIRTGAAVAVATDVLAAKDASGLCLIGAGAQGLHQVLSIASVRQIHRVVVDQLAAAMDEAGDIIRYVEMNAVTPDRFTELGTLLTSTPEPRTGMTIFKSVGLAIQDWAVASLVARRLDEAR